MVSPCHECDRLALVYAETIRTHALITWRYFDAKSRQDSVAIASIKPIMDKARQDRQRARVARQEHADWHLFQASLSELGSER
jgi:hypothetical protein